MEHRHSQRKKRTINAKLFLASKIVEDVTTDNISSNGLFVRLPNTQVRVMSICKVVLSDNQKKLFWIANGLTIHSSPNGVGLVLDKEIPKVFLDEEPEQRFLDKEVSSVEHG